MKKIYKNGEGLIDLGRLLKTSPYVLLFPYVHKRNNSADRIRYYHARIFWKELPSYGLWNMLKIYGYFIFWPYYFFKNTKRLGKEPFLKVRDINGKSVLRQLMEQFYLAFFYSVSAREYYMYEFYKNGRIKCANQYLMRTTFKPLIYSFLDKVYMKKNELEQINHQDSKSYFDKTCKEYNLEHVPILIRISSNGVTYLSDIEEIKKAGDLFIKPEQARGGQKGQIWEKSDQLYSNVENKKLSFLEILEYFKELKAETIDGVVKEFIVQPRIINHRDLQFGTRALSTVRINTLLISKNVTIPYAVFRFSTNTESDVDNFHAGGFASPIEISSGRLGPAANMGFKNPGQWIDTHPVSHTRIRGITLPFWKEVKELVINSHSTPGFNNRVLLGWDVAITDEGPKLIECNGWSDIELIQKPYNKPLGKFIGLDMLSNKIEEDFYTYYFNK